MSLRMQTNDERSCASCHRAGIARYQSQMAADEHTAFMARCQSEMAADE